MPTYEYECLPNRHRFEVKQSFTDPSLTRCEVCGEPVRKVFSAAGIVFRGSGYYVNDSRAPEPSTASKPGSDGSKDKGESTGSGDKAKDRSDNPTADKGSTDKASSETGSTAKTASDRSSKTSSTSGNRSSE
ncbi:MAG TPA: FmdB family zinc ribbon protein [Euzebya sp.]|nr:FmdB family zinc ribbon protein [Euzebya sp.]